MADAEPVPVRGERLPTSPIARQGLARQWPTASFSSTLSSANPATIGPRSQDLIGQKTLEDARLLGRRSDLSLIWVTKPPIGFATIQPPPE